MPSKKRAPGPHPKPPRDLRARTLPLLEGQGPWFRIHQLASSPLYFGSSGDNRFDAPSEQFGVLYVANDMFGAFVETLGHDTGKRLVAMQDLQTRALARIDASRPLRLVDLTGAGLAQLGADSRLCSGTLPVAQRWSLALFNHPDHPDGISYRCRHDPSRVCAAVFDRVQDLLRVTSLGGLTDPGQLARLGSLLDHYNFGLK